MQKTDIDMMSIHSGQIFKHDDAPESGKIEQTSPVDCVISSPVVHAYGTTIKKLPAVSRSRYSRLGNVHLSSNYSCGTLFK